MRPSTSRRRRFRVLIATDGSPSAQAALLTARVFPWPRGTRVQGLVALRPEWLRGRPEYVRIAVVRSLERVAMATRQRLTETWPDAEVVALAESPVEGILHQAVRFSANVIVLGWRGHGRFRRLLIGSVSRGVVERARAAVLVVRRPARHVRRMVVGIDGSSNARRAVDLLARLRGGRMAITVVRVVEQIALPMGGLLPGFVQAQLLRNAAILNTQLLEGARRDVASAAARLKRSGWAVRTEVRRGTPLAELLRVVKPSRCDVLVVGARGTSGLKRALLGSVAEGALNRSSVPVLVVR